jgi:hypothetical protein
MKILLTLSGKEQSDELMRCLLKVKESRLFRKWRLEGLRVTNAKMLVNSLYSGVIVGESQLARAEGGTLSEK